MNAPTKPESLADTSHEIVETPTTVELIAAAEINQQIATAHRFPRSMELFKRRAMNMVSLDEETAASCIYRRPVGKKRDEETGRWVTQYAEGMSIRMAEIVGAAYGNLRVQAMLIAQTPTYVVARGVAHDLEANVANALEVVEPTIDSNGNPYSERMRLVVAKAALSKARRDATFAVVPRALCKSIEELARKVAIGDATTLEKRRAAVMQWIQKLGVDQARVFAAIGVRGESDISLDHLETLTGLKTALKDGDVTIDEAFPPIDEGAPNGKSGVAMPKSKSEKAAAPAPAPSAPVEAPAPAPAPAPAAPAPEPKPAATTSEKVSDQKKAYLLRLFESAKLKREDGMQACGLTDWDNLTVDGFAALQDWIAANA